MPELLLPDPFLAACLDRPAYTLSAGKDADPVRAVAHLRREGAFAPAKVRADDVRAIRELEEVGFRLADINLTMERQRGNLSEPADGLLFRSARPEDEAGVRHVARTSFRFSRFHQDPRISKTVADGLKAAWAGNYFSGERGDAMMVAEADGQVAGFLLLLNRQGKLVIDLIAVSETHQGRGAATGLIAWTDRKRNDFDTWLVGTQAANTPSLGFYASLGFRLIETTLVFHFHGDRA